MVYNTDTGARDPLDAGSCTCMNLRRAARAVSQAYDAALKPCGLKATQYTLLAMLDTLGPTPISQMSERLVLDRTALSRNLKPLERDGLVRVVPGADQRVRNAVLTAAGARALREATPRWQAVQRRFADGLGDARWSGLLDDLGATIDTALGR